MWAMIIKASTLEKIRKIIEEKHTRLMVGMLGPDVLSTEELVELRRRGIQLADDASILERLYYHNYLNPHASKYTPTTLGEMKTQQNKTSTLPVTAIHEASKTYLNQNLKQLIEKQKADVLSRIEGLIQDTNNTFKFSQQQKLDDLVQNNTVSQLKIKLRDLSHDGNRSWDRVVNTEVSNAISLGSVDRIVDENIDKPSDEVYVYRIVQNDAALCKYCRKFYMDSDGTPKVYKLSTLLGNGSNYGKKREQWLPVANATHPNERCSQVIELKPGWRVLSGGSVTFIGKELWNQYIQKKVIE